MTKTPFFRTLIAATAFLVTGGVAIAQSPECQRFRAELAALDRGGGQVQTAAMQAQRNELNRLLRYYRSIGCERGPLGFLAGPAPAECPTIAGQIRQMEAGYARLAQQATDSGEVEFRRRAIAVRRR